VSGLKLGAGGPFY